MNTRDLVEISVLILLVFAAGSANVLLSDIRKRIRSLGRIEAKLDLLLKQGGIEFDPYRTVPREVVDAVQGGRKIEAIKLYRRATGLGLREAKSAIEALQQRAGA